MKRRGDGQDVCACVRRTQAPPHSSSAATRTHTHRPTHTPASTTATATEHWRNTLPGYCCPAHPSDTRGTTHPNFPAAAPAAPAAPAVAQQQQQLYAGCCCCGILCAALARREAPSDRSDQQPLSTCSPSRMCARRPLRTRWMGRTGPAVRRCWPWRASAGRPGRPSGSRACPAMS